MEALSDVKVLSLDEGIAGPYATKLLADFGAEVVKIEHPGKGDKAREMGPFLKDEPHPEKSGTFFYLNSNKKSITLNLENKGGVKIFRDLVKDVDVVVESFERGVMTKLGLSYEALKDINPYLIMTSISWFGQSGPYRDYKGTNLAVFGLAGAMYTMRPTSKPKNRPVILGGQQAKYVAGLMAFIATMTALINRSKSNEGRWIDVSIMECLASVLAGIAPDYSYLGMSRRTAPRPIHGFPTQENYPCKDGWMNITPGLGGAASIPFLIGNPELKDDRLFARPGARQAEPEKFEALVLPWLEKHNRLEITEEAQQLRLAFAPLLNPAELVEDEQYKAREFLATTEHPVMGKVRYPGFSAKFSEITWKRGRAPLMGEHNEEIYTRLGYTKNDLSRLREQGII